MGAVRDRWWLALAGWIVCAASPALAHQVGLSRGTWVDTSAAVTAELVFARADAQQICPDFKAERCELTLVVVERGGERCTARVEATSLEEEDGYAIRGQFACRQPGRTTVDIGPLLARLAAGHRHLGRAVSGDSSTDVVAYASAGETSSFSFGEAATPPSLLAYLGIGVEHILLGFDHLVFLFGLLLVAGRLRSLLGIITAFTIAHSISLALAVLDVVVLSPAIVEPLIAISIAVVGVENFFITDAKGRWRITAPFGLIHGFGFAGALAEVGMPKDAVAPTLFLFNVGVELGQLAVLAVALPVLWLLRTKTRFFVPHGQRVLSTLVVAAGLFWFVERVFLS
jgi:hypothetical protein